VKFYFLTLTTLILLSLGLGCATTQGYDLEYFEGGRFRNLADVPSKTPLGYVWMRMNTTAEVWPENVPLQKKIVRPKDASKQLRVHYINHSTFLIQTQGLNILTDPIFADRASPLSWAGPKRVIRPGLEIDELPKIDVVLISHDHYDHLDLASLRELIQRDQPKVLVGLGVKKHIETGQVIELKWWQEESVSKVKFVFVPAQHSSGRGLFDQKSTLWGSFVIETSSETLFFAGDTGYADHFSKIRQKFGDIDLSLLPIGAYAPRSFMKTNHMDPKEATKAHADLGSKMSLGMHWGTFQLTNEGRQRPKEYFENNPTQNFYVPQNGDCFAVGDSGFAKCESGEKDDLGFDNAQIYPHLHQATRWAELMYQNNCAFSRQGIQRHLGKVKYNNPRLVDSQFYQSYLFLRDLAFELSNSNLVEIEGFRLRLHETAKQLRLQHPKDWQNEFVSCSAEGQ
jgi:L-ascorbate metabolism protein UlaG (beta-lactamase superfamily)